MVEGARGNMGWSFGAWARGAFGIGLIISATWTSSGLVTTAHAEIRKVIFVCVHGRKKEICPQFRASVEAPDGWIEDKIAEARQGRVIFVPKGKTYDTAPAAVTVQTASLRARTTVETLVERDNDAFRQDYKDAIIAPLAPVANARIGGPVKLFRQSAGALKPRGFQITAIFADRDADGSLFSVVIVASALTERGLAETRPKLEQMIKAY